MTEVHYLLTNKAQQLRNNNVADYDPRALCLTGDGNAILTVSPTSVTCPVCIGLIAEGQPYLAVNKAHLNTTQRMLAAGVHTVRTAEGVFIEHNGEQYRRPKTPEGSIKFIREHWGIDI